MRSRPDVTGPIEITPELQAWGELARKRKAARGTRPPQFSDLGLDEILVGYFSKRSL